MTGPWFFNIATCSRTPDWPFPNFRASRSRDHQILFSSGTSCDGLWSSKGSVGLCTRPPWKCGLAWTFLDVLSRFLNCARMCVSCSDVPFKRPNYEFFAHPRLTEPWSIVSWLQERTRPIQRSILLWLKFDWLDSMEICCWDGYKKNLLQRCFFYLYPRA